MTFWGIEVRPGKPYTHPCNKDGPPLRISQATLSYVSKSSTDGKTSTKRSVVQCNVGKSSPVFLCALLPGRIETCPLDLEFKEDQEVVFSVLGPQSIHITGYYLNVRPHHLNGCDDDIESYGEDIGETESDASRESEEDEYDTYDSFINDGDPGEQTPPRRAKTKRGDELIHRSLRSPREKKEKCGPRHKRLKKKYQMSDSDEDKYHVIDSEEDNDNEASQQQMQMKKPTAVLNLDSEEEDKCLISSFLKSRNSIMAESSTMETPEQEKLDAISRKVDQPCDPSLLSIDDMNVVNGTPKDKRKTRRDIVDQERSIEDIQAELNQPMADSKCEVYKEDENTGNQLYTDDIENQKEKDKVNEDLKIEEPYLQPKEHDPINSNAQDSSKNLEDQKTVDQPCDPSLLSIDDINVVNGTPKDKRKKKKDTVDQERSLEDIIQAELDQPMADSKSEVYKENGLCEGLENENIGNQLHTDDMKLKKKKKKKKGNENMTHEEDGIPPQVKEPFLENLQPNPVVGDVQEFSAHSQDESERLKKKQRKKKSAKSKMTMSGDDVGELLESEGLRIDSDQRTNTDTQNEKVHGLNLDKVGDENEINVPRKKKRKQKSESEMDIGNGN